MTVFNGIPLAVAISHVNDLVPHNKCDPFYLGRRERRYYLNDVCVAKMVFSPDFTTCDLYIGEDGV